MRSNMTKETGHSEFGRILGGGLGGNVVKLDCTTSTGEPGDIVFISSAFNPLTAKELQRIARFMELNLRYWDDPVLEGEGEIT